MKIIDGKAYKEIDINELEKTELIEIIEGLQKELESKKLTGVVTSPNAQSLGGNGLIYTGGNPNVGLCRNI